MIMVVDGLSGCVVVRQAEESLGSNLQSLLGHTQGLKPHAGSTASLFRLSFLQFKCGPSHSSLSRPFHEANLIEN